MPRVSILNRQVTQAPSREVSARSGSRRSVPSCVSRAGNRKAVITAPTFPDAAAKPAPTTPAATPPPPAPAAAPAPAPAPTANPSPEEVKAFDDATRAFRSANYAVARQFFADFVRLFPLSDRAPEAILYQARSALEQGNLAEGIALLESRVATGGKVADEYRYWLGEAQYRMGNGAAAAEQFALLLKNHPTSARRLEAAYGEARARYRLREWERTVELLKNPAGPFREAARQRANDELVTSGDLMLAEAQLELRNPAAAEEGLKSIATRSFTPEMRWRFEQLRCRVLSESQRYPEALEQSAAALKAATATGIPSATSESVALQAAILARLNRPEEAAQAYARNLSPETPAPRQREALLQLIQLHLASNNFIAATQKLELLMAQTPGGTNSDIALLTYGEIRLREYLLATRVPSTSPPPAILSASPSGPTNLLNEAMRRLDHLIRVQPLSPLAGLAHLDRGWALEALGQLADGQEAFRAAAAAIPLSEDQAVAQYKLAELQFRLGDLTNSLASFRTFTNRFLQLPKVRNTLLDQALMHLVRIGFELHDERAATEAAERLLSWRPQSELIDPSLLLMGQRLSLLDQPDKARAWLSKVSAASPMKALAELLVARTYTQENLDTNALAHYQGWLSRFPESELRPRVEFELAASTYRTGDGSNAFQLYTNFLFHHPTNLLAPQAMFSVGDYYMREGNLTNAQIQFQKLYESTNFPVTELTYRARMQAGRAAFARQGLNDAQRLFSEIVQNPPPYPDLVAQAYFALGDCLMMQAAISTNAFAEYLNAATAFSYITKNFGTNEIVPKAWGSRGNCFLQLAKQDRQDASYYEKATNSYQMALTHPAASVGDRSQARVGMGIALAKLAESYSTPREQRPLQEQAQVQFGRVIYDRDLLPGEKPDRFWQKKAGLESIQLAELMQDWPAAQGLCEHLKQLLPPLAPELDRRIARLRQSQQAR